MNGRPDGEARRARAAARRIISHHLGDGAYRVCARGGGATNHVYEVAHPEGTFIVRLSLDPAKIHDFQKEQWAIAQAREAGVPVPQVLEVGNQPGPFVYMVSNLARGEEATRHPQRMELLEQLGALAARIHRVATHGFGSTFDWSHNQLSRCETWDAYLGRELALEARLETLAEHGGVDEDRLARMRERLQEIGGLAGEPRLNHGDLRLKNVLATREGRITALIDWEFATSNAAPFWDTSLALHDLSIDEKHAYLAGYGLDVARLAEIAPHLKALNLLNYAPYLQRAVEAGDAAQVERCRTRLSGALDLYSL
ncbi:MAG: aminoglycoside phosphotransferase family protein [Steroidobacteraceae bacterium]|jgi:hygromycin-B 4-O-kinase|nr:aminoglycoside phosphotransferase family protein [Steroidobacteraceae bacterium]